MIKIRLKVKVMGKEMGISDFSGNSSWFDHFMKWKKNQHTL